MLKFQARIFGGELPIGLGVIGIAVVLPRGDFLDEGLFVGNAAIEALGPLGPEFGLGRMGADCRVLECSAERVRPALLASFSRRCLVERPTRTENVVVVIGVQYSTFRP